MILSILRRILPQRPDLRLIIMSATANVQAITEFFRSNVNIIPSAISVPGKCFPIQVSHLEDTVKLLTSHPLFQNALKSHRTTPSFDDSDLSEADLTLIEAIIAYICRHQSGEGAILCFLPSWAHISRLRDKLVDDDQFKAGFADTKKYCVHALHSMIPLADQQKIFLKAKNVRKIILSTNIAETSLTVRLWILF